jgi:tRNA uridine 5-carboxymethylaminomethyl modification enzyme
LNRSEAYAAVLVDDLTSKGLDEPYRLFTSRAEHRLLLGVDTVLRRLVPHGLRLGLLSQEEHAAAMSAEERVARAEREVASTAVLPDRATREALWRSMGIVVDTPTTVRNLLKRLDLHVDSAAEAWPEPFRGLSREERQIVQSRARYEGYIRRENQRMERLAPLESRPIPAEISYRSMPGLSTEMVERCERRRPRTLGEAARLPGLTPAALAIISAHVARGGRSAG